MKTESKSCCNSDHLFLRANSTVGKREGRDSYDVRKALGSKTIIPLGNQLAEILNLESTEQNLGGVYT